ncbi:hypothetical protein IAQ61_000328 [Plenodomus lingam]|uniref:uncharacterized protein n=1 Tax=Leptosphaeria maculans TaxID=5022 RepID=UPI0033213A7D|nr:hypothetical protein IAQ61_000328 [Plenodomus lingam]
MRIDMIPENFDSSIKAHLLRVPVAEFRPILAGYISRRGLPENSTEAQSEAVRGGDVHSKRTDYQQGMRLHTQTKSYVLEDLERARLAPGSGLAKPNEELIEFLESSADNSAAYPHARIFTTPSPLPGTPYPYPRPHTSVTTDQHSSPMASTQLPASSLANVVNDDPPRDKTGFESNTSLKDNMEALDSDWVHSWFADDKCRIAVILCRIKYDTNHSCISI